MPEKTAKSFITWKDGKRYYRCGDLVSEDANGRGLFIYGRCDNQVKIGGVRLEIEGVENEIHNVIKIFCGLLNCTSKSVEKFLMAKKRMCFY